MIYETFDQMPTTIKQKHKYKHLTLLLLFAWFQEICYFLFSKKLMPQGLKLFKFISIFPDNIR